MTGESFEKELLDTIKSCTTWAQRNYIYAHIVFIISVLGSFTATVLAASTLNCKIATATFAALPGLMLLINNTLRFEERTKWFWRKARMAEGFYRRIRDAKDPTTNSLSSKYSEESEKLEIEWPAFGNSPGQPKKGGTD